MNAVKFLSILLIVLSVSSCSVFRKSRANNHIETEGSYEIVSQTKYIANEGEPKTKVEGYVFDDYSREPVSYGYVFAIENNLYRTLIDSTGYFSLLLPSGTYSFKITSAGNKDLVTEPIKLSENTQTQLKIYLGSDIMYETEKKSK